MRARAHAARRVTSGCVVDGPCPTTTFGGVQEQAVPRAIIWTIVAAGLTGYALLLTLTAVQVGEGAGMGIASASSKYNLAAGHPIGVVL